MIHGVRERERLYVTYTLIQHEQARRCLLKRKLMKPSPNGDLDLPFRVTLSFIGVMSNQRQGLFIFCFVFVFMDSGSYNRSLKAQWLEAGNLSMISLRKEEPFFFHVRSKWLRGKNFFLLFVC